MTGKIARFVGADASGNGIYDVSPPIGGEDRVVAVHVGRDIGFYPPGACSCVAWWTGNSDTHHAFADMGYTVVRSSPVSAADMVREFHAVFGHPIANTPGLIPRSRAALRHALIAEELQEFYEAIAADDLVEIADALGDLMYVVHGAAIEYGIPLDDAFREIHDSNMSKLGEDGKPIHREDGKVLKGPNFDEPKIAAVLKDAGWPGE